MKIILSVLFLAYSLIGFGQQSKEKILGKWDIHRVFRSEKNVTKENDPSNNRYITFNADGTFESGGDPYGINTGIYTLSENGTLFIDSDAGEGDDSMWVISFDKKQKNMTWKNASSQSASEFVVVLKRSKK